MSYISYTQEIITAVDEFDYLERIKPSAIMQYFQDLATAHAIEIGVGYEEMKAKKLCWVLSRLSAKIDKYPRLGETITVTTYPRKPNVVDAVRDYYITNSSGETLIRGTSKWCVLDIENRAIRRCSQLFNFAPEMYKPDAPFEDGNMRLSKLSDIATAEQILGAYKNVVKITDLDRNVHMNNARYGDVILNACDMSFLNNHSLKGFDVNFLAELVVGENYDVYKTTQGDTTYFEAVNDKQVVPFRAKIEWLET